MLFSSLEFLYFFLPLSVLLYFLCPLRWRNLLLLLLSLLFYGFGEPLYVFLMLFTISADYAFGLFIERSRKGKRAWLVTAVIFNLSLLGFFKYYDLAASLVKLPTLGISLPIGISFYTFQALSYVIDVYRKEVAAQKSFVAFGTYVSLYPQLIAGPIVRYKDIDRELLSRKHSIRGVADGIAAFCAGLAKKTLLANQAGALANVLLTEKRSVAGVWLGLLLYAFQIYYDFSGYSDMAIGLGKIFGFNFPENFNYPYISKSITEFWRRWHITLSTWFREYVYIPLGGNRRGRGRTYLNLFVVWSLTGLWHGATISFLLWGIYFFLLLVIEKAFLLKLLERLPKAFRHGYAIFFILVGWMIFFSEGSLFEVGSGIASLFGFGGIPLFSRDIGYELLRNLPFIALMSVGATPLPKKLFLYISKKSEGLQGVLQTVLSLLSIIFSTVYIVDSGYNPFLYFRF